MTRRPLAIAAIIVFLPLSAVADEALRYCGTDVPYDVSMLEDTAIIMRSAEVRATCAVEDDVLICDDGAEIPFLIEGDDLVLHPDHPVMPVVMPRCE